MANQWVECASDADAEAGADDAVGFSFLLQPLQPDPHCVYSKDWIVQKWVCVCACDVLV